MNGKSPKYLIILGLLIPCVLFTSYYKEGGLSNLEDATYTLYLAGEWHLDSIYINGNWDYFNETYDWCYYKDGFYIIENVTIDAENNDGIIIANTQDPFILRNCSIFNSAAGEDSGAIKFISVKNGILIENNISHNNGNGILTVLSENITLINNVFNNNVESGVLVERNSNNFSLVSNQINNNGKLGVNIDALHYSGSGSYSVLTDHKILNNKINNNTLSGIRLFWCVNSTINENEIYSNGGYGIFLDTWCANDIVTNNHIIYKEECIYDKEGNSYLNNNLCQRETSISPAIPGFNLYLMIMVLAVFTMIISYLFYRRFKFSFSI